MKQYRRNDNRESLYSGLTAAAVFCFAVFTVLIVLCVSAQASTAELTTSGEFFRVGDHGDTELLPGDVTVSESDGTAQAFFTTDHAGIMGIVFSEQANAPLRMTPESCITELTVTPPQAENYGKVRISVSFSDGAPDEHVFHQGDTLTVSWPSGGDAYLKGYRTTIPLINAEGVTYGVVEVTETGAVLTFNEEVDALYDVHGSFFFEVMAINASPTNEEDTQSVTVTAGDKTAEVSVHKHAASGEGGETPDFRKDADFIGGGYTWDEGVGWVMSLDPEDPTYVQWTLTANENQHAIVSDVTITDTIGLGMRFDPTFLTIYSVGTNQSTFSGTAADAIDDWQSSYPGSSLTIGDAGGLTWTISQEAADGTFWGLVYRCDIVDFEQAYYENTADIIWEEDGGETFSAHDEARFYDVGQGGGVHVLPRGVLQITKKVGGTDVTVPGVTFAVEKLVGGEWLPQGELITDDSGRATMTKLKTGRYRLYETSLPSWLASVYTEDDPYEVTIDAESGMSHGLALTVENPVKTTSVTAEKTWENADGSPDEAEHPTIRLRLLRQSAAQSVPVPVGDIAVLTDGTTQAVWDDLPVSDVFGNAYTYTVREVDDDGNDWTPAGYEKQEDGLTVVIRRRAYTVRKVDPAGEPLTGAVFELAVREDGVFQRLGEAVCPDGDGAALPDLEPGRLYRLEEKQAPEGYVFTEQYIYFILDETGLVLTDETGAAQDCVQVQTSDDGFALIVTNLPGAALPQTGGPGRNAFAPLSFLLFAAAAILRRLH